MRVGFCIQGRLMRNDSGWIIFGGAVVECCSQKKKGSLFSRTGDTVKGPLRALLEFF